MTIFVENSVKVIQEEIRILSESVYDKDIDFEFAMGARTALEWIKDGKIKPSDVLASGASSDGQTLK